MPKAYKQHRRRIRSHKKRARFSSRTLYAGALLIFVLLVVGWWLGRSNPQTKYDTRYEVTGTPSVNADFINRVLDSYGSPAHGKGQALYDLGVKYDIDPVYALAFFMHESSFGTTGVAQVTLSLGNIRATDGYASFDGYRQYHSWEEGFEDWYKLIKVQYVQTWKLSTVDQIVPVYAPSSDNNDVDAYIQSVENAVTTWRSGQVQI
ncbi:MAG: glucosaminidase domain-containing protein [Ktedonobacteraceae bacterium]